jgi:hypothetical protein
MRDAKKPEIKEKAHLNERGRQKRPQWIGVAFVTEVS